MDYMEIKTAWGDHEAAISPTLSDRFKELTAEVGECLISLDIPDDQRDHLGKLIGELIKEAEENACSQGIDYGTRYTVAAIAEPLNDAEEDQDGKARPPPDK